MCSVNNVQLCLTILLQHLENRILQASPTDGLCHKFKQYCVINYTASRCKQYPFLPQHIETTVYQEKHNKKTARWQRPSDRLQTDMISWQWLNDGIIWEPPRRWNIFTTRLASVETTHDHNWKVIWWLEGNPQLLIAIICSGWVHCVESEVLIVHLPYS